MKTTTENKIRKFIEKLRKCDCVHCDEHAIELLAILDAPNAGKEKL